MIEKKFIKDGIKKAKLEEYLETELRRANYSHIDITMTPTSTNIIIWSEKPSLVIGRGGHRINEIIDDFENRFNIENPQVDAREVEEPDLDANVVAKNVAGWLEKGGHPKRVGHTYVHRVMEAGAVGVQIEIAGKLSGSRGRREKFLDGYVKKCGNTAREFVDQAYEKAVTKPGALGIKVKIMKDMPEHMKLNLEQEEKTAEEIAAEAEAEEEADEAADEEAEVVEEDEIDAAEIAEMTVGDAKDAVRDEDFDPAAVLRAEREGKARKTLVGWLENRVEDLEADMTEEEDTVEEADEGADEAEEDMDDAADEEAADTEDIDYDDLVSGTIADVKDAVEADDLDLEALLQAERDGKDRVTLVEWLERRMED